MDITACLLPASSTYESNWITFKLPTGRNLCKLCQSRPSAFELRIFGCDVKAMYIYFGINFDSTLIIAGFNYVAI